MVHRMRVRAVEAGRSGQDTGSVLKVKFTNLDMEYTIKSRVKVMTPRLWPDQFLVFY